MRLSFFVFTVLNWEYAAESDGLTLQLGVLNNRVEKDLFKAHASVPAPVSEPRDGLSDLLGSFPVLCFCGLCKWLPLL